MAAKEFILLVLLICFLTLLKKEDRFQIIDLFAGQARLAKLAAGLGLSAVALDRAFDSADNPAQSNSMDLCTNAGFVSLA